MTWIVELERIAIALRYAAADSPSKATAAQLELIAAVIELLAAEAAARRGQAV